MYVCMWLQMMWDMSGVSTKVCERIIETGLDADIMEKLSWETMSVSSLNDPQSSTKREVVIALRGVLHNVVQKVQAARSSLRKCNAVDVLQKFRDVTEYPVIFALPAERRVAPFLPVLFLLRADFSAHCTDEGEIWQRGAIVPAKFHFDRLRNTD